MSSLLREAIVDAKALREAALKNAETVVIDKYSDEVRQTLEKLLEQEDLGLDLDLGGEGGEDLDLGMDMGAEDATVPTLEEEAEDDISEDVEDVPFGATADLAGMNGKNLKKIPGEGENVEVTLDLGALREAVETLEKEIEEDLEFNEEDLAEILSDDEEVVEEGGEKPWETEDAGSDPSAGEEEADKDQMDALDLEENEELELSEELIDALTEKLTVDLGADLSGWAGRPDFQVKQEMEKELARRRSTDVEEDLETLKKAQEELVFENKQLKEQLSQYERATHELKEGLQTVNLSNARLLYTNRVLRNASLNERQKKRIVEAISQAGSVTEAKTIFNTLESTVESRPSRRPRTLSEAINRPSSVIRASRKEVQNTDPFLDRMKKLAGIN
jgi:copper chaperone CopZ